MFGVYGRLRPGVAQEEQGLEKITEKLLGKNIMRIGNIGLNIHSNLCSGFSNLNVTNWISACRETFQSMSDPV